MSRLSHKNEVKIDYHKRQMKLSYRIIYAADNLIQFL